MPLVTTDAIAMELSDYLSRNNLDLEVYTEFPDDTSNTSEGIYITRFYQETRTQSVLTCMGVNMYDVVDRLEMYLIQGQLNPYVDQYLDLISSFIDDAMFTGYSPREYTVEQLYRKNNESYRIIFNLTRQQIT